MRSLFYLNIMCLALFLFGCKGQEAFRTENYQVNPHGSYADVRIRFQNHIRGEMLYLKGDTLAVLTEEGIEKVDITNVKEIEVRVATTTSNGGTTAAWSIVNFIWSFGHGGLSLIANPVSLIGGFVLGPTRYYQLKFPQELNKHQLKLYCRFPQGLPPNCNENTLTYPSTF